MLLLFVPLLLDTTFTYEQNRNVVVISFWPFPFSLVTVLTFTLYLYIQLVKVCSFASCGLGIKFTALGFAASTCTTMPTWQLYDLLLNSVSGA